ncbi:hypothetical protein HHI36_003690 [Cryptolaemus montrouzieri]|uniref:Tubulin epsilon and delta complex protein 1 domain-containing protein n=1 Tax=Cryptolaemus montrouzieri TaxID=559131 RepID=A0ABD2PE54_9CUCU
MTHVKKSLAVICAHLNYLFDINLTTEDFRLAKFGDKGVVTKFSKLLNILTINEEITDIEHIKDYLKSSKDWNSSLFFFTNKQDTTSKDLLLATASIYPTALRKRIDMEIEKSPFNSEFILLQNGENQQASLDISGFTCERDYQKYTDWLRERFFFNLREIRDLRTQNKKILEKLRNCFNINTSNINELLAGNNVRYKKLFIEESKRMVTILLNHHEWTKIESTFWKWMVSVLETPKRSRKISKMKGTNQK